MKRVSEIDNLLEYIKELEYENEALRRQIDQLEICIENMS